MSFVPVMFENCPFLNEHGSRRQKSRPSHLVPDLTDDIINAIAIAQAMFGSENVRNTNSNFRSQTDLSAAVDKGKFQVNFDVQHFKPEEIIVKITGDNTVTIEAKHEENPDDHGQIFRHFIRKYVFPKNCDLGRLESRLSTDGVLTVIAPYLDNQTKIRTIPIAQTGKPAISVKQKESEKKLEAMSCN